jgi:phage-related tail protein
MATDNKPEEGNGWTEWKRKVLSDIERIGSRLDRNLEIITQLCTKTATLDDLRTDVRELTNEVQAMREEIAVIKTRLATYGAVSGAVAGVAVAIITAFIMQALGL